MKSITFNLQRQVMTELDSASVSISFSDTLSTLRGASFFTSAYSLPVKGKGQFFLPKAHYNRLKECYFLLYSRCEFSLTETQFNNCIDQLLFINPLSNTDQMQVLIVVLGGKSQFQGSGERVFSNGFEGDIRDVLFIAQPMNLKPQWSFTGGINVMTYCYQRSNAQAKPTSYWGGIHGQWRLTYYNTFFLLAGQYYSDNTYLEQIYKKMIGVSVVEQSRRLALSREVRLNNISFLTQYSFQNTDFDQLVQHWLADKNRSEIIDLEGRFMKDIIHDVIFTSPEGMILEGSTFSLLILDKNRHWVIIPLESEAGVILESITVKFIKNALLFASIDFIERGINVADLKSCMGVFAVSSTRLQFYNDRVELQPIRHCNGNEIGQELVTKSSEYLQLSQALLKYQQHYQS
tara:strand:+ start:425 stop:1639 length:1215 start_codon:yes stop_codon:yes gene_type:complete